jgi:hypothetical protein
VTLSGRSDRHERAAAARAARHERAEASAARRPWLLPVVVSVAVLVLVGAVVFSLLSGITVG